MSHSPPEARQTEPALPAVAVQVPLLQRPTSHGLPGLGSVHTLPFAFGTTLQLPPAPHTPALWHSLGAVQAETLQHIPSVQ